MSPRGKVDGGGLCVACCVTCAPDSGLGVGKLPDVEGAVKGSLQKRRRGCDLSLGWEVSVSDHLGKVKGNAQ